MTPCFFIDAASSFIFCSSKVVLGWYWFVFIFDIETWFGVGFGVGFYLMKWQSGNKS